MLCYIPVWLLAKAVAFWLFGKEFDLCSGFEMWLVIVICGWMTFRDRWTTNEKIFLAAQKADAAKQ